MHSQRTDVQSRLDAFQGLQERRQRSEQSSDPLLTSTTPSPHPPSTYIYMPREGNAQLCENDDAGSILIHEAPINAILPEYWTASQSRHEHKLNPRVTIETQIASSPDEEEALARIQPPHDFRGRTPGEFAPPGNPKRSSRKVSRRNPPQRAPKNFRREESPCPALARSRSITDLSG